jgi:integrase
LLATVRRHRYGHRDATMILVAYRHGLRVSELVDLRWDQIDFAAANLHVRRVKQGTPSTHPVLGDELRALRRLRREQEPRSPFVFTSERAAPFSTAGFARMIERAGGEAKLGFKAHPHMLRHACGYALANKGRDTRALQAYLGHRNIQHTVRYTELSPTRFKDFWTPVDIFFRPAGLLAHRPRPRFDAIRWRVSCGPSVRCKMIGRLAIVIRYAVRSARLCRGVKKSALRA